MMGAVANVTKEFDVPTTVSLNAIMVDGTGMCGGCRVSVGGKTVYACVEGPEFDAHQVDFKQLADRLAMYRDVEKDAFDVTRDPAFTGAPGEVRLMTLDPGHFHAALVQKSSYPQVDPRVHVFAPDGPDVEGQRKAPKETAKAPSRAI